MPSPKPVVLLDGDRPITAVFDMNRLVAIEIATGKTCNELLISDFREWARAGDMDEDPQARDVALRRFSIGTVRSFLAGVLGCEPDEVQGLIPPRSWMKAFAAAMAGFGAAVAELNGLDETGKSAEPDPTSRTPAAPAS